MTVVTPPVTVAPPLDVDAVTLPALDDGREVLLEFRSGKTAKTVVSAERHDHHLHIAFEGPVQAAQASRGGVAGHAGVGGTSGHPDGVAGPGGVDGGGSKPF